MIYMKPNELNTFLQAEKYTPVVNDMRENTSNYAHESNNALFNNSHECH